MRVLAASWRVATIRRAPRILSSWPSWPFISHAVAIGHEVQHTPNSPLNRPCGPSLSMMPGITIKQLSNWLLDQKYADAASLERITSEARTEMEAAVKFAIAAPYPGVDEVDQDVYA